METNAARTNPWVAGDVSDGTWLVPVSAAVIDELIAFSERYSDLDFQPTGPVGAESAVAELVLCQESMREAGRRIREEFGFVVLDAIPVDRLSKRQCRIIAWAMFSCIGRVVDQKVSGTKVYDVQDKGVELGYGVRRSITNLNQEFHTDAGWLDAPPEIVGLFCLEPAEHGGLNQLLSLIQVHNVLKAECPEHLERLYQSFWWDRQSEHRPEEPKVNAQPVFYETGGGVHARYYDDYIRHGQQLADEPLDVSGEAALAAMRSVVERSELQIEFGLDSGQFLLVNNRQVAHSRSAFSGVGDQPSQRHYLRLWSRRDGSTALDG